MYKSPDVDLENGMVTIVVTIDEELLRRMDASLHPDNTREEEEIEHGREEILSQNFPFLVFDSSYRQFGHGMNDNIPEEFINN